MSVNVVDVVIAGAGIVGAACAEALSRDGLRVAVVQPGGMAGVATGATAAGMGHLVVMDDSEAQFALTRHSLELWSSLAGEMPAEVAFDRCGTIWIAADEADLAVVRHKHRFYADRGVASEILDPRQLAQAEPNLRAGLAGGLLVPGDRVLNPVAATRWLLGRATARGATLVDGRVMRLSGDGATLADGTRLACGHAVNATGCRAPSLTPGLDVRPRKGHLALAQGPAAPAPRFVRHQLVELAYLRSAHAADGAGDPIALNVQPRSGGRLVIGSTREFVGDDAAAAAVDRAMLARMMARAIDYLPRLADLAVLREWTGFRPATRRKLPLIGPTPADPRLLVATGHQGLGITTSVGTGALIADLIAGRPSAIPVEPYFFV